MTEVGKLLQENIIQWVQMLVSVERGHFDREGDFYHSVLYNFNIFIAKPAATCGALTKGGQNQYDKSSTHCTPASKDKIRIKDLKIYPFLTKVLNKREALLNFFLWKNKTFPS